MLIFLYGADSYRRERKKREIVADFVKKHSALGLRSFDMSEEGATEDVKEFLSGQSMFEPAKLAVISSGFDAEEKTFIEELKKLLAHSSTTILFSEETAAPKAFRFLAAKPALVQKFEPLKGMEWRKFAAAEATAYGITLSAQALLLLAEAYEGDSWRLVTEIQKAQGLGKKTLEIKDLELLDIEAAPVFWEFVQGLKSRDLGRRLMMLEKLFELHEPGAKIFNILSSMWADRLPLFAEGDLAVKSGKLEYDEALLRAVLA